MSDQYWSIPRLWPGATVIIVAGGPSLSLRQIHHLAQARLAGKCKVIAVNDAIYPCWWADWHHFCDEKWPRWHVHALKAPAIKTSLAHELPSGWNVHRLFDADDRGAGPGGKGKRDRGGFFPKPYGVRTGGNGAYQAIGIAIHAGAKRILLLGVDMKRGEKDEAHWFGEHPDKVVTNYGVAMAPWFPSLVEPLAEMGIEVINCSLESALTCFPKARLEDVLERA